MRWFKKILNLFNLNSWEDDNAYMIDLAADNLVEQAKKEWLAARNIFNETTEEELVDYAIHEMEAAERKFMYLLKEAKKEKSVEVK
ncbi:MAG: DUF2508 family protein [Thermoanaerobacteraceae bacterium]|nr:DUF2508 family protein [Thermoanaerobacteraceae bacterium]